MSDWKFGGSLAALLGGSTATHPQCPCRSRTIAKTSEYGADPTVPLSILRFTAVFDFSGSPTNYAVDGDGNGSNALSKQLAGPHLSEDVPPGVFNRQRIDTGAVRHSMISVHQSR
ncbi:hypothetical protein PMN64_25350 [Bradyrhizobium sp. UFLA01-814]|uniref:hypothetical protein n=1 Tax=Bradyrhizobium sp. UFLA01-814 TaxID=3023480 RepID=UPI00398A6D93